MNLTAFIIIALGIVALLGCGIWKRDALMNLTKRVEDNRVEPAVSGPSFKTASYLAINAGQKLGPASIMPIVATYGGINAVQ